MTDFILQRRANDGLSTIGELFADGDSARLCWILEPGPNTPLHPRIPAGTYPVELRKDGAKYQQFLPVFGALIAQGLPHIIVPGREWVLVHPGNTVADTEACNLPGLTRLPPSLAASHHWEVESSRDAFRKVYPLIRDARLRGAVNWQVINEAA